MKYLVFLLTFSCLAFMASAQPGGTRISMGSPPNINLNDLELRGPIKEVIELEYYSKFGESYVDTSIAAQKTIMKFDKKGDETEELKYGYSGKLLSKCSYDYTNPKMIVIKKFIRDTLLLGKYVYTHNDNGKIAKLDISTGKYAGDFRTIYEYNNKGYKAEETTVIPSKDTILTMVKTIFQYDENGRKTLRKGYDYRGNLIDSTLFSYDALGNITEISAMNMAGMMKGQKTTKCTKTDKYGNWRLKTTEDNSHMAVFGDILQKVIVKRIILYY